MPELSKEAPPGSLDSESNRTKPPRLMSLDALRGFDMFWILGGEKLFAALFALTAWSGWMAADAQMKHTQWHGFTFYDLIFPLFIFLSGVALGLSPKRLDHLPMSQRMPKYRHAVKRLLLLLAFGVLYNHGWGTGIPADPESVRYASVLGRIAFAWFFAAIIVWHTSLRTQIIIALGILLGYAAMHLWLPLPGVPAGSLGADVSINAWVDQHLLPGISYQNRPVDPEGILSTLPAIVNALAGVFTGHLIVSPRSGWQKAGIMAGAGALSLLLGWGTDIVLPVNKELWTSSFVLVTVGWSLLLLSLFYVLVDLLQFRRLAMPFVVIGCNAIIIYLASSLVNWDYVSLSVFGGIVSTVTPSWQPLLAVIAFLAVQWALLVWMYRRNIFIKV
ncbi:transmembrane glucosamine N-acetyltransferase NagX [Shewanella submarina]|uniref:Transmembrane glucosamine N-acetyltransferase NagX n=1 Tax=Shewanella submarina TaxID=2016376 RepID=A0ABV7GAQ3_9GAMM